jgi:SAM-dependent methyltransferase
MHILNNVSAGRLLDVATGRGGFIHTLLDHLRDFEEMIGIDVQSGAAAIFAEAFQQPNIRFLCMDAAHIDFPPHSFDTVTIANSLHHLPDLPAVLDEMLRVLKPGGRFICLEMYCDGQNEAQMTHVLMHHWWAAVDRARGVSHNPTFTRQELIDLLLGLGLEDVQVTDEQDLEGDAFDAAGMQELNGIIDRYGAMTAGLPGGSDLQQQGEDLRQRLQRTGFQGATSLVFMGKKSSR